ncbi:MAG TPA: DHA2 family efflux MFS transporter permease subunit [Solirubrobacteraceae bacterium]|nr:DHA2 family efflux MFS transporter permease subunit [Solirubrobacteraceae bacterium]
MNAPGSPAVPDRRRRLLILGICSMSLLIVGLDSTIVNVALPSIRASLGASVSGLQWTIDAYTLVLASLLMLSGSTADRLGRRRVFQLGLVLFSLGSLLCALAPSLNLLIAARILQAIGGSMLNPVAMSIIRNTFEDPRELAQAIGVWGGTIGISLALGPLVGGALVDSVGWPAVFLVNLPIGLAAIILTALFVPESRAARARRIDPVGQVLVIVGLAALTYAIIEGPGNGWLSAGTLAEFALAIGALGALVVYELHRTEPLIEIRFFSSAPFSGASAIAVCAFAALGGFLFLNTLYLQDVRGLSPLHAGLYLLPMAAVTLVVAPLSGRMVAARGSRLPLIAGSLALTASAAILTQLTVTTPAGVLFVAYFLFGLGFGLVNPPITHTAVSGMPPAQAGVAAAVASTSRQVGQTLGVAVLGALSGAAAAHARLGGQFTVATHTSWWVIAALGVIVFVLAVITTTGWALNTARATAARLSEPPARASEPPVCSTEPVTAQG